MTDEPPDGLEPDELEPDEPGPVTRERAAHDGWLSGRHASAAVIGVLTLLLGFAIAVQVHANSSSDSLDDLREDDLVSILDNQDDRADRLRIQINQLQTNLQRLQDSGDKAKAAREQANQETAALGVLLGTLPATGPGVTVIITDPDSQLDGEALLDVVEELRGAGAEAIEFGGVRVSTSTAFFGGKGDVSIGGTALHAPYQVVAIGGAKTLDTALNIPGGVAATVRTAGGQLRVAERRKVSITAIRAVAKPKYAEPSH